MSFRKLIAETLKLGRPLLAELSAQSYARHAHGSVFPTLDDLVRIGEYEKRNEVQALDRKLSMAMPEVARSRLGWDAVHEGRAPAFARVIHAAAVTDIFGRAVKPDSIAKAFDDFAKDKIQLQTITFLDGVVPDDEVMRMHNGAYLLKPCRADTFGYRDHVPFYGQFFVGLGHAVLVMSEELTVDDAKAMVDARGRGEGPQPRTENIIMALWLAASPLTVHAGTIQKGFVFDLDSLNGTSVTDLSTSWSRSNLYSATVRIPSQTRWRGGLPY